MSDKVVNQDGEETTLVFANMPSMVKKLTPEQAQKNKERLAKLSEMSDKDIEDKSVTISEKYWEAEDKGDSITGIFHGWRVLEKSENDDIVKLLAGIIETPKDGTFLNCGTQLVQALHQVQEGSLVKVTYTGKSGRMKIYEVKVIED